MQIQIVSFYCTLKNKLGRIISSTFNQDVMTHGFEQQDLLRGLAEGLQNLRKGEKRRIFLTAEEAYGFYEPDKVLTKLREDLPFDRPPEIGDHVSIKNRSGERKSYRITQMTDEFVTLDGNHPLAGQDLIFEIEATDVREATAEEISQSEPLLSREVVH